MFRGKSTPKKVLGALVLVVCAVAVVYAASPHFVGKVAATLVGTNVRVDFKEAGLGDNQNIDCVASANGTATYVCVNNGGQCPNAANKATVSGPVTAEGTFNSGQNGQITASLTFTPPGPGTFSCPGGQTLTLNSVTYSGISISDTTNNVSQAATPSGLSAGAFAPASCQ